MLYTLTMPDDQGLDFIESLIIDYLGDL